MSFSDQGGSTRAHMRVPTRLALAALAVVVALATAGGTARADGNEAPGNPATFRSISSGGEHACALLDDGTVRCWGDNTFGQLGQGDTDDRGDDPGELGDALPAIDLGTGRTATAITAGGGHTCALLDDGTVKCWGLNASGQLGQGDKANRGDQAGEMGDALAPVDLGTGRTATAISVESSGTCAILDDGSLKCWGFNGYGQLGQGDNADRGDEQGELGDELPAIDLGTGRTATAVSLGALHTCALLDDGSVKCWGYGFMGQLGQGGTDDRGDQPGELGDDLPAIDLGTGRTATAISAGSFHACALLDDGSLTCWGNNNYGQLGQGDTVRRGDEPGELGDALPAVDLGTGRTAIGVSANEHTCALLDDGSVTCWGNNDRGQLGRGDTGHRGDEPGELGDDLLAIDLGTGRAATAVSAGDYLTCALLDTRQLKCWGYNESGQLGQGDTDNRGDGPDELGDVLAPVDLPPVGAPVPTITTCLGFDVTVDLGLGEQPTTGSDVILGTTGGDVVRGLGGDDVICGRGGNDTLRGGGGRDRILGGAGADALYAGPDGGLLAGNGDGDLLVGGRGNDTLRGGFGDDTLTGNAGNDLGDGGADTDHCTLTPGRDTVRNCEG